MRTPTKTIEPVAIAVLSCSLMGVTASAVQQTFVESQTGTTERTEVLQTIYSVPQRRPDAMGFSDPRLFFGLDAGYSSLASSVVSEADTDGYQSDLKVLLSVYLEDWVFDAGLGWLYDNVTGSPSSTQNIQITTRAGFFEVSPRARLGERLQLGPIARVLYGTDLSFASTVLNQQSVAVLGGLQMIYDIPYEDSNLRVGLLGTTDLSVPARQQYVVLAGIQLGIPFNQAKTTQITRKVQQPTRADFKITLDPGRVFFKTDSAEVLPRSKEALSEIARFLKENSDQWREIDIAGHADQRGSFNYNVVLSMNRSLAIKNAFKDDGLTDARMTTGGYGYTDQLDPRPVADAYKLNRRVEISFFGVKDPVSLKAQLDKIQAKWSSEKNLP